jgi:hypothetical protein
MTRCSARVCAREHNHDTVCNLTHRICGRVLYTQPVLVLYICDYQLQTRVCRFHSS